VILRAGYGEFDNVAYEVGHHRAASAALRIEVSNVGYRHVVRKVEGIVPVCIAVEDA
jgi:hypothetical protein